MLQMVFDLFFISILGRFVKDGSQKFIRKILLINIMFRIIMCILISDSMTKFCCSFIMRIFQMIRHLTDFPGPDRLQCIVNCHIRCVALWGACHITDRLG